MSREKLTLEALNRVSIEEYRSQKKTSVIVVLEDVRSAMNVGSIFRSVDAFALERIILAGITPVPPHKEINKTAIGATESVSWSYSEDLLYDLDLLKKEGYKIISIEQTNDSIALKSYDVEPGCKYVLILGNEVSGVSDEVVKFSDECIEISQFGTKHSLNVSVCAGIVFWAFSIHSLH